MPNHDAGKTRFAPTRSLDTNLPLVQSLPDHDDEPPLQSLRSCKQSITAETHLTDVVGQTDTLLRQVNGVGPVTSLAYVLTLETPQRFKKSRDVGPYLGLVPQQEDSGDSQPQLGISKAGDRMLRKLLVGSAQYILGPFGPDTELRRFGMKLCQRGGKNAKKRASVAVARKLAVLLHRLWSSGEVYEPLGYGKAITESAAA